MEVHSVAHDAVRGLTFSICAALVILLTCIAGIAPAAAENAKMMALGFEEQGENTIVVLRLNRSTPFTIVTLPEPYRVVVDFNQLDFPSVPSSSISGVVKAFRFGQFAEGKARVVLDTDGPVQVVGASTEVVSGVSEVRITLATTTERAFGKVYRRRKRREAIKRQDAAAWAAVAQPVVKKKSGKKVIIIDPGHGGVDSGALAAGRTMEKHVVLAFAHQLRKALTASGKYVVHMTRRRDVFVPLKKRVEFARRHQADLFISVHADSVASKQYATISGTTIYTLSDEGSDSAAQEFAERENRSDVLAGIEVPDRSDELASILIELAQRETNARSVRFARTALGQIRKSTRLSRGPHRSAAFAVLKAPDIPSVLIELGYLSNAFDAQQLKSPKWRASVARSLTRSVTRYFAQQVKDKPF